MKHSFEIIYFYMFDVGRSVDLKKVAAIIPANPDIGIIKRRDTPASLSLPKPLIVQLFRTDTLKDDQYESITINGRIFDEGVIGVSIRVRATLELEKLPSIETEPIYLEDEALTLEEHAEKHFKKLFDSIKAAITFEQYVFSGFVSERYTVYCLNSVVGDHPTFIKENERLLASILSSGDAEIDLHKSQIQDTLREGFSFTNSDTAIFDLDRCLLIDTKRDYEDVMLIIEHANFQLLELRTLDRLLDRWLDEAEHDIKIVFKRGGGAQIKSLKSKIANLQAIQFDAMFILENLENSSKIVGDYYLGQVYSHLCKVFNTGDWKNSIEKRLDVLQSLYEISKTDASDRNLLFAEWLMVLFFILQILQAFMLSTKPIF